MKVGEFSGQKVQDVKKVVQKQMIDKVRGSVKNNWELVNIFLLGRQFWLKLYTHIEWTFGLHYI